MLRFKSIFSLLIFFLCSVPVLADTYPPIGQVIHNSIEERSKLKTGCFLTYDVQNHKLRCAKARVVAEFDTESLAISKPVIPSISCSSTGSPCRMTFSEAPAGQEYGGMDFIMPDSPLVPLTLTLGLVGDYTGNYSIWQLDWCQYAVTDAPCAPSGSHLQSRTVNMTSASDRYDAVIQFGTCCTSETGAVCSSTAFCTMQGECANVSSFHTCVLPTWNVNDHIVIHFTRLYNDSGDNYDHPVYVEGGKIEFLSTVGEP